MTGQRPDEYDEYNETDEYEAPPQEDAPGPSRADMERFNREESEYLDYRRSETRSALWKLAAGSIFILIAASMILGALLPAIIPNRTEDPDPNRVTATVSRIFDARTIGVQIDGVEQTVRYIGIDGPLFGDPLYESAVSTHAGWVLGNEVVLESDEVDADGQGRLLRYVWVGEAMVNLNLVASGFSRAGATDGNDRYANLFSHAEQVARIDGRGIWEGSEEGTEQSALLPAEGVRPEEDASLS